MSTKEQEAVDERLLTADKVVHLGPDDTIYAWNRIQDDGYIILRIVAGKEIRVIPRGYNTQVTIANYGDPWGYDDSWCFDIPEVAVIAVQLWNYPTQIEPEGWFRNPRTARRRPGGDKSKEYIHQ